jgi:hypothetical protein
MVSSSDELGALKRQIEFYLSDLNLTNDRFFRREIQANKDGWVDITHFLQCNKVKAPKVDVKEICLACASSEMLEVSENELQIRRKENRSLP